VDLILATIYFLNSKIEKQVRDVFPL
jgi:hypothetical protein